MPFANVNVITFIQLITFNYLIKTKINKKTIFDLKNLIKKFLKISLSIYFHEKSPQNTSFFFFIFKIVEQVFRGKGEKEM